MKSSKIHNRLGRIEIHPELLNSLDKDSVKLLFGNFYPTHIQINSPYNNTYYGFSEHFEPFEKGMGFEIPLYVASINTKEKTINFVKE